MWLAIKIGVLYGAPTLALLLAVIYFAVLLIRVRRGTMSRAKAAALYPGTLLLPVATVIVVWGTGELASYFAVAPGQFAWDSAAALQFLISLVPVAAYVGAPIVLLIISFWAALAFSRAA